MGNRNLFIVGFGFLWVLIVVFEIRWVIKPVLFCSGHKISLLIFVWGELKVLNFEFSFAKNKIFEVRRN